MWFWVGWKDRDIGNPAFINIKPSFGIQLGFARSAHALREQNFLSSYRFRYGTSGRVILKSQQPTQRHFRGIKPGFLDLLLSVDISYPPRIAS